MAHATAGYGQNFLLWRGPHPLWREWSKHCRSLHCSTCSFAQHQQVQQHQSERQIPTKCQRLGYDTTQGVVGLHLVVRPRELGPGHHGVGQLVGLTDKLHQERAQHGEAVPPLSTISPRWKMPCSTAAQISLGLLGGRCYQVMQVTRKRSPSSSLVLRTLCR